MKKVECQCVLCGEEYKTPDCYGIEKYICEDCYFTAVNPLIESAKEKLHVTEDDIWKDGFIQAVKLLKEVKITKPKKSDMVEWQDACNKSST